MQFTTLRCLFFDIYVLQLMPAGEPFPEELSCGGYLNLQIRPVKLERPLLVTTAGTVRLDNHASSTPIQDAFRTVLITLLQYARH